MESIATHEEFIARLFGRIGWVVVVGRPGQRLPFCGAARFSLPHDAWKPVVSELIQRSELLLLVASTGRARCGNSPKRSGGCRRSACSCSSGRVRLATTGFVRRQPRRSRNERNSCPGPMLTSQRYPRFPTVRR